MGVPLIYYNPPPLKSPYGVESFVEIELYIVLMCGILSCVVRIMWYESNYIYYCLIINDWSINGVGGNKKPLIL